MSGHTLGPWRVSKDGFAGSGLWSAPTVFATDDELRYIAVCACADDLNIYTATDNLANARLIAAAPELLDALRKVAQTLDWYAHGRCRGIDDGPLLSSDDAVELAEAVIAKAMGEPCPAPATPDTRTKEPR